VAKFKYSGTTVTNRNLIHEEIKSILNSGNACYHSVQNPLSYYILSKNLKTKIRKTIILPLVLVLSGYETWSLTLGEENRLRVFESMVLRRILGRRGRKWWETGKDYIMWSFITCTPHHQIFLG
jgi:hypothetical protein